MSNYRTFLVPYDFSQQARIALDTAAELAECLNAHLHLFHVVRAPLVPYGYGADVGAAVVSSSDREKLQAAKGSLDGIAAALQGFSGKIETQVVEGLGVSDVILNAAEILKPDLIVMSMHGRTGFAHAFLGSVAQRTLRKAPCPVLVVPPPLT